MKVFVVVLFSLVQGKILWAGPGMPEKIGTREVVKAEVNSGPICQLQKAYEHLEKAKSHYEFLNIEEARRFLRRAVLSASRKKKMCSEAMRILSEAHLLRSILALIEGDESTARMFMKKAVIEGLYQPLSEDTYPPPVTRLHQEVLSQIRWCELRVEFPVKNFTLQVDGRRYPGGRIPCGDHFVEVFVDDDSVGFSFADVTGDLMRVPVKGEEAALRKLIGSDGVDALIKSELMENGVLKLKVFTSIDNEITIVSFPEDITEQILSLPGIQKAKENSSSSVQFSLSETRVDAHQHKETGVEMVTGTGLDFTTERSSTKTNWWKNPYLWGGVAGAVIIAGSIWAGVTYGRNRSRKPVFIITW